MVVSYGLLLYLMIKRGIPTRGELIMDNPCCLPGIWSVLVLVAHCLCSVHTNRTVEQTVPEAVPPRPHKATNCFLWTIYWGFSRTEGRGASA